MKKVISGLLIATMFSTVAGAQTVKKEDTLKQPVTQQDFVDDFEDDDTSVVSKKTTVRTALKPTNSKEASKLAKKNEVPENIKQDFREDDGYLLEGFQLGVGLGALGGVNAQLGYRIPQRNYNFWKNRFGFRLDYNSWKPLKNKIESYLEDNPIKVDDNEFTGMISGTNYGALVDFYPFGNTWFLGNFRISGGYYTGDFAIDVSMHKSASAEFEMKDIRYSGSADATLTATLDADVKGPYLGAGFDFALLFGLKLYFDAGVVFTDHPQVLTSLDGTGELTACYKDSICKTQTIDANNAIVQELLANTKAEYEDELDIVTKQKIFPMVKLGLMLRF
ncbi:MAG: hypothetical protein IJ638_03430 [Alphaproteobacteria bacterium]|nr:hypothetical protein [Alphaproteobacteria bacterium]